MSLEIIQIIEADEGQARTVDQVHRKASFRTNIAFDGPSGIQDIWKNRPALVVMDLMIPGIGGKDIPSKTPAVHASAKFRRLIPGYGEIAGSFFS